MEGGATNFAVGLLLLWLAALCFFFALHPGGVGSIKNPVDAIKWMITQFQQTQTSTKTTSGGPNDASQQPASPTA